MIFVVVSGLLVVCGLWLIPSSFAWLDKRVAARARRRAVLEQLRLDALAARKAA
jgi:hypothetical protein